MQNTIADILWYSIKIDLSLLLQFVMHSVCSLEREKRKDANCVWYMYVSQWKKSKRNVRFFHFSPVYGTISHPGEFISTSFRIQSYNTLKFGIHEILAAASRILYNKYRSAENKCQQIAEICRQQF